jgi:Uma2 family endonuclease
MSTAANRSTTQAQFKDVQPLLVNGDRLSQPEFHRRYATYPDGVHCELIGGIVFMASPLRRAHGRNHVKLIRLLEEYESQTPGIELLDNATAILGKESELQPDLCLRVLAEFGGQSAESEGDYVEGAPELVAEIAQSTRAIDLHLKRHDYQRAGVLEYMVLSVEEPKLTWFNFTAKNHIEPDARGIARSQAFPGLWIDVPSLLAGNREQMLEAMTRGLKSPAHRAFVKKLKASRRDEDQSGPAKKKR